MSTETKDTDIQAPQCPTNCPSCERPTILSGDKAGPGVVWRCWRCGYTRPSEQSATVNFAAALSGLIVTRSATLGPWVQAHPETFGIMFRRAWVIPESEHVRSALAVYPFEGKWSLQVIDPFDPRKHEVLRGYESAQAACDAGDEFIARTHGAQLVAAPAEAT